MGPVAAAVVCVASARAGAAAAHAFCPGISGHAAYPKGGKLAQLGYSLGFYGHDAWEVTWRT